MRAHFIRLIDMSLEQRLAERSHSTCELCGSTNDLTSFAVEPSDGSLDQSAYLCQTCTTQIKNADETNINHWRCLTDSMWNQEPAIQVLAWRQLTRLAGMGEIWAQDALELMYLDDDTTKWAHQGAETDDVEPTLDSNGSPLQAGDNVTLIKDLDVKGAGFTAKRGTVVRGISLTSNPEHIEGRVNGTRIVLVSKFLKKSS
jgi:protein PhnA